MEEEKKNQNIFEPILYSEMNNTSPELDTYIDLVTSWALAKGTDSESENENISRIESSIFFKSSETSLEKSIFLSRMSTISIPVSGMVLQNNKDQYVMVYTLSGSGLLFVNGKEIYFNKGDGYLLDIDDYQEFYSTPNKNWRCLFLFFNGEIVPDLYNIVNGGNNLFFSSNEYSRFNQLIKNMAKNYQSVPSARSLHYSNDMLTLLVELTNLPKKKNNSVKQIPQVMKSIRQYLLENYQEPITLDLLTEKFHISKFHLNREFKKYMNSTPNEFLILTRLEKAKELLDSTDYTVSDIGQKVGIKNPNHFLYLFKKHEGMTPSAFRKYWANRFDIS